MSIIRLKATMRLLSTLCIFNPTAPLLISNIDLRVERFVMLEHAVDNPQDLMHADAQSGHLVYSLFPVFFIKLANQRIVLSG